MTIIDCCISLKMIKKILVVLGVVDMRQLLLIKSGYYIVPSPSTALVEMVKNLDSMLGIQTKEQPLIKNSYTFF